MAQQSAGRTARPVDEVGRRGRSLQLAVQDHRCRQGQHAAAGARHRTDPAGLARKAADRGGKDALRSDHRDLRSNVDTSTGSRSELLTALRAQRTQLNDQIAQKRAVLGIRHPDVIISLTQRDELERQIETERRRICRPRSRITRRCAISRSTSRTCSTPPSARCSRPGRPRSSCRTCSGRPTPTGGSTSSSCRATRRPMSSGRCSRSRRVSSRAPPSPPAHRARPCRSCFRRWPSLQ